MIFALICGIVTLSLLFFDLITKAWAYAVLVETDYLFGIVRLSYLPGGNTGIAFGWFGESEWAMVVFIILTLFMMGGIAALFFTVFQKNRPARVCLSVIEAGAIGNFVDRVFLGTVRDFIDVQRLGFGICNPADFFITFGAVALLIVILFVGKEAVIPLGKWRRIRQEEAAQLEAERMRKEEETALLSEQNLPSTQKNLSMDECATERQEINPPPRQAQGESHE